MSESHQYIEKFNQSGSSASNIGGIGEDEEKRAGFPSKVPIEHDRSTSNDISVAASQEHDRPICEESSPKGPSFLDRITTHLTATSLPPPGPPPDGGFHAWLQVALGWLVIMSTWGLVNSFGVFQTYYSTVLMPQFSDSEISWIGSTQTFFMFFLGTFSGRALDYGLFVPAFALGIVLMVLGMFLMSISHNYWQLFLTQGVLTGAGGGIFFTPTVGLVGTYFDKHRGLALGMATTGNAIGGLIYPLIVRQLLPKAGFAWTMRVLAFVNLGCLLVVLAFMRPRLPPRKAGPIIELSSLKDVPFVLFVLGICFTLSSNYFVFYYIASYGRAVIGLSYTDSLNLILVLNGVGVPARLLPGLIADRYFGVLNTFAPIVFVVAVVSFCWLSITSIGGFYAFVAAYGICAASFQSLFPTVIASLTPDLSKLGTRLGMAFTVLSFASLLGAPIGGALLTADDGGYRWAQVWAGLSTFVGACLIVSARIWRYGWALKVKC
ncbi:MFS transporter, MCP family, solute carrier family 16, member 10 [Eremomyces bilateralis CBS 781.70]|uniref:MFS transporter, MCP family, solute carrier family 16, member 10 n=1 Tax=Eremomyces bilateralis CBS 781.70 TaxID=1392243 RepID=A0A6G1GA61_9PEZI|nr:MFS transporter, MCP family, solute carrier family 16, member 10 [Eremomyces bilateralis CBS 781.70]KAF1814914.1 MFS transporter, MCP family, solute carrier family 16, member 10 [Eremomyces bilateralis CBS 781.70]